MYIGVYRFILEEGLAGKICCACAGPLGLQPEVWGDLVLVLSACLWSFVMVRQSRHAPNYAAFPLGTFKACSPHYVHVVIFTTCAVQGVRGRRALAQPSPWQ